MKKILLICVLPLVLGACVTRTFDDCNGFSKSATVNYGDNGMTVTPKVNQKKNKPFFIMLKPKPKKDWKDKPVKITGKSRDPSVCPDENWLNREDSYDAKKKFEYCTPKVPVGTKKCKYEYTVEVKDGSSTVLLVDPRIEVEY